MLCGITGTLTKPVILDMHLVVEGIKSQIQDLLKSKIQNPGFNFQNPRLAKIQHPESKFQKSKTRWKSKRKET